MKIFRTSKGITLINLILVIIILIIGVFLIVSKTNKKTTSTVGKSTLTTSSTSTSSTSLFSNKPSSSQIASATTIDYRSLYKGSNTLKGNFYKITGEIVQDAGENIYHVNMTKTGTEYFSYYTDRIQVSIIGNTSELLMEGDIISFVGESLGNYTYTTVLGSNSTIPFIRAYAENVKVIGHTD